MKLLDRIFGRKAAQLTYDQVASLIDSRAWGAVGGVHVTERTALQVSTVLACVKTIADGCATPDLNVYREKKDGTRERATNIPEYRLLNRRPNEWQTSVEWRRQMTLHAALTGAALSIKVRGDNRRTRELIPVEPGRWDVRKVGRYELRYRCWDEFGMIGEFEPDDVFVLHGLQWQAGIPLDALQLARSAIGLAIVNEKSQASLHENGLRPSGTYSVSGALNEAQYTALTKHLQEKAKRPHEPLVLDRDAKWYQNTITGQDAQAIEQRRMQVEEICRSYGVFPIMVGHSDKASTFASSEAFFSAHVKHTLAPWHKAWTQRIDEMLLDGSGPLFAEFDTRYLLAGDMKDRAQWARTMAEMGIYTRNELRDEEGKDPLPGLDEPLTPLNMSGGKEEEPKPQPEDEEKSIVRLEQKLDAAMSSIALAVATKASSEKPPNVSTNYYQLQADGKEALQELSSNVEHMQTMLQQLNAEKPIQIVLPPVTAPDVKVSVQPPEVTVNVEPPDVNVEAVIQPAPVVVSGPVKSVQTVERDEGDEITRTVTTHTYKE